MMRWRRKQHQQGDRRFVRRFAVIPTRVKDVPDTVVWLTWVWREEECQWVGRAPTPGADLLWCLVDTYLTRPTLENA